MPPGIAEDLDHEIRGAVHHARLSRERGGGSDEAAEADAAHDLVEIADRRTKLGEEVDGAELCRGLRDIGLDSGAERADMFGSELSVRPEAELAGDGHEPAMADEGHVIRDRRGGRGQRNAEFLEARFDPTHDTSHPEEEAPFSPKPLPAASGFVAGPVGTGNVAPRIECAGAMIFRFVTVAAVSIVAASSPVLALEGEPIVRLAPHRAVYDLSLVTSRGMRGIESAKGRIVFEFTGNACEGYALKFRQVTVLQSAESGERISDLRTASFESGDGKTLRFRNDSIAQGSSTTVDGTAERRPGPALAVKLTVPRRQNVTLDGEAVFPNAQMKDILVAAREGRSSIQMRLFDGSDDGRKVYETLALIGARIEAGHEAGLEEPARQEGLAKLARWPVVLSYFTPGRADAEPSYTLGFDLYENGVSRALKLDYGDFALKGEMVRLDLLPEKGDCQR